MSGRDEPTGSGGSRSTSVGLESASAPYGQRSVLPASSTSRRRPNAKPIRAIAKEHRHVSNELHRRLVAEIAAGEAAAAARTLRRDIDRAYRKLIEHTLEDREAARPVQADESALPPR